MTLEEMTAQRDALLAARFRGVRTVEIDGRRVTAATDAEMAAAITDLERRMALAGIRSRKYPDFTEVELAKIEWDFAYTAPRIHFSSGSASGQSIQGVLEGLTLPTRNRSTWR